MKRILTVIVMLLACSSLFADAAEPGRKLTVKTFQFKHKQADRAAALIKPLMSVEGSISIQPSSNALAVTDTPENLKKIAAALAGFDAPVKPVDVSIRLVSASRGGQPRIDPALDDVAPKLALLRYNVLETLGSADVTGREGETGLIELGGGYRAEFRFGEYDDAAGTVRITDFKLSRLEGDQLTQVMKTTLNLKEGQTVIIGATKQPQSQRALMIVATAKR